jgi:hypothetical protein
MLTSIEGKYRNGKIELNEQPAIEGEVDVVVTFMSPQQGRAKMSDGKMITFGMLAEPGRKQSTLEDFKIAEYDDSEWDRE